MVDEPWRASDEHPRRRILAGGAGLSLGIMSAVLPDAARAASPLAPSSTPTQPSLTATYDATTDLITISAERTLLDSGASNRAIQLVFGGGVAYYDLTYTGMTIPAMPFAADSYTASVLVARQLTYRGSAIPTASSTLYAYMAFPDAEDGALYTDDLEFPPDEAEQLAFTGCPTDHFGTLLRGKATGVKEVTSSGPVDVVITKPAGALDADLMMLAGVTGQAWAPSDLSVEIREEDPDAGALLGTLTYLTDDGLRLAVLASASPIALPTGTTFRLRIRTASATSRLSYSDSSFVNGTGWSQGTMDGVSGYMRWSLGLRS